MLFSPSNPVVCSLCDDEVSESSAYTINSSFLEAIRSVKRFKGVNVNIGEKVCSKHLIESKDVFGKVAINIRSYESAVDSWNLSPPHKRAKRREMPSSRASGPAHGISDFSIASSPSGSLSDSQHALSSDFTSNSDDLKQDDSIRIPLDRSPRRRRRRHPNGESASSMPLESIHSRTSVPNHYSIEALLQNISTLHSELLTIKQHIALKEAELSHHKALLNQNLRDPTPLQSTFHLLQVRIVSTPDEIPTEISEAKSATSLNSFDS